jgi:tRNA-dihydrouridine synthase A
MMAWTDRHDRYFLRVISRKAHLYTEMVTTAALIHGPRDRLLAYSPEEHPLALQLGGADPRDLAQCARMAEDFGFDEVNLNVGCPSDRVQTGRFGACLMAEPDLVARCIDVMARATNLPVTVKCRIGIDDQDPEAVLPDFARSMHEAGAAFLVVHARKAWLQGLSPKDNREIPPLDYDLVGRLKAAMPEFPIVLNGGIDGLDAAAEHVMRFDGVMLGRAAYNRPYLLAEVDTRLFGAPEPPPTRRAIVERLLPYIEREMARGARLHDITRHILGLYHGQPRGRLWRRMLSEETRGNAGPDVLMRALDAVDAQSPELVSA